VDIKNSFLKLSKKEYVGYPKNMRGKKWYPKNVRGNKRIPKTPYKISTRAVHSGAQGENG
jgi:hypothetical protein